MRFVFAIIIIVSIEAKKKRPVTAPPVDDVVPKQRNIDVYPESFRQPVPFGHIFKDGFFDPKSNLKPPIDLLELQMVQPRTQEEAKRIWETRRKDVQILLTDKLREFANPRDKYLYEQQNLNADAEKNGTKTWIDWEAMQQKNIARPMPKFRLPQSRKTVASFQNEGYDRGPKSEYFAPGSFDLAANMRHDMNWTTCDEFGKSPNFHPKDIVDIDWIPFYVWAEKDNHDAVIYRFSYPTKKLVKQYKEDYGNYLNKTIDWDQPKLVLNEMLEMLLIAGDRAGMFHGVPHLDFPSYVKNRNVEYPTVTIRLKVKDPYLAIMYCEHQFTAIMAVLGDEPPTGKDKVAAATVLKFRGSGYPVYRDIHKEKMRAEADREWLAQKKENEVIKIEPPIHRDHFLDKTM